MKGIKNIRMDYYSVAPGSCPRGGTLGSWGSNPSVCQLRYLLLSHWTEPYQILCEFLSLIEQAAAHYLAHPLGRFGRAKRSNIIKFQLQRQFQRFLSQTFYVFSQIKYIKHIRWDYHLVAWAMPQGWDSNSSHKSWGVEGHISPIVRYAISSQVIGRNSSKFGVWVTPMNVACNSTFI